MPSRCAESRRGSPFLPRVAAAGGDFQRSTHGGDPVKASSRSTSRTAPIVIGTVHSSPTASPCSAGRSRAHATEGDPLLRLKGYDPLTDAVKRFAGIDPTASKHDAAFPAVGLAAGRPDRTVKARPILSQCSQVRRHYVRLAAIAAMDADRKVLRHISVVARPTLRTNCQLEDRRWHHPRAAESG